MPRNQQAPTAVSESVVGLSDLSNGKRRIKFGAIHSDVKKAEYSWASQQSNEISSDKMHSQQFWLC